MALHFLIGLAIAHEGAALWLPLLLTYLAHAFVWALVAGLVSSRRGVTPAAMNVSWKAALVAPFVTTLVATHVPAEGLMEGTLGREPAAMVLAEAPSETSALRANTADRIALRADLFGACVLATALVGLARFAGSGLRLRRLLRGRRPVADERLRRRFERMRVRVGLPSVVLTESAGIESPLVIGRSEVCVPLAKLEDLASEEVDAIFTHELAHLERGDGLWFPVVGLIQSMFWIQPLNHLVASRFRRSAELACDERAVELTHAPLALARALVRVAEGAGAGARMPLVPAMARPASFLRQRVQRLTDGVGRAELGPSRMGKPWALVGLVLAAVATAGASIRTARAQPFAAAVSEGVEGPATPSEVHAAPDVAALSREMAKLIRREREVEAELSTARSLPDAHRADTAESIRVLELEQELRHVREARAWTEQRAVEDKVPHERRR